MCLANSRKYSGCCIPAALSVRTDNIAKSQVLAEFQYAGEPYNLSVTDCEVEQRTFVRPEGITTLANAFLTRYTINKKNYGPHHSYHWSLQPQSGALPEHFRSASATQLPLPVFGAEFEARTEDATCYMNRKISDPLLSRTALFQGGANLFRTPDELTDQTYYRQEQRIAFELETQVLSAG